MSTVATRVPLAVAVPIALELGGLLARATERVEIAGSIRRRRPTIGDIELAVIPRIITESDGLFGERRVNVLTRLLDTLVANGTLAAHPTDPKRGDRYSKLVDAKSGLQVDVFSATADTFGLILLIRTGSAAYSQRFVTDLRGRGLHVAGGELHRGGLGCGTYVCEVVPTPNEQAVYSAARWPFREPEIRA